MTWFDQVVSLLPSAILNKSGLLIQSNLCDRTECLCGPPCVWLTVERVQLNLTHLVALLLHLALQLVADNTYTHTHTHTHKQQQNALYIQTTEDLPILQCLYCHVRISFKFLNTICYTVAACPVVSMSRWWFATPLTSAGFRINCCCSSSSQRTQSSFWRVNQPFPRLNDQSVICWILSRWSFSLVSTRLALTLTLIPNPNPNPNFSPNLNPNPITLTLEH